MKLSLIIPDKTNYIERYEPIDYVYAIHYPELELLKVGLSRTNPWHRCRMITTRVKKAYGVNAIAGLRYVVMSGSYHDEQKILQRLSPVQSWQPKLTSPTEWFHYRGIAFVWFEKRWLETQGTVIYPEELEVRTKRRKSKYGRSSSSRALYIPRE